MFTRKRGPSPPLIQMYWQNSFLLATLARISICIPTLWWSGWSCWLCWCWSISSPIYYNCWTHAWDWSLAWGNLENTKRLFGQSPVWQDSEEEDHLPCYFPKVAHQMHWSGRDRKSHPSEIKDAGDCDIWFVDDDYDGHLVVHNDACGSWAELWPKIEVDGWGHCNCISWYVSTWSSIIDHWSANSLSWILAAQFVLTTVILSIVGWSIKDKNLLVIKQRCELCLRLQCWRTGPHRMRRCSPAEKVDNEETLVVHWKMLFKWCQCVIVWYWQCYLKSDADRGGGCLDRLGVADLGPGAVQPGGGGQIGHKLGDLVDLSELFCPNGLKVLWPTWG